MAGGLCVICTDHKPSAFEFLAIETGAMYEQVSHSLLNKILDRLKPAVRKRDSDVVAGLHSRRAGTSEALASRVLVWPSEMTSI